MEVDKDSFVMMKYLLQTALFLISSALAVEVTENVTEATELIIINGTLTVNNATTPEQKLDMQRITKPSLTIPQQPETTTNRPQNPTVANRKQFVPSPQLDTIYEFNRYPVVPVIPESKHIRSNSYLPPPTPTPNNFVPAKYYDRLNFRTTTPTYITTEKIESKLSLSEFDKPERSNSIKFLDEDKSEPNFNSLYPPFPFEWPTKEHSKPTKMLLGEHPYPFMTTNFSDKIEEPLQKMTHEEEHAVGKPLPPWKKMLKLLATFVPIGLLLSAFTPNILTIGAANETALKLGGRSADSVANLDTVTRWTQPGCEARLLCELSLLEDADSVERSRKLFWIMMNRNGEDAEVAGQLQAVSNAIKRKSCVVIKCERDQIPQNVNSNH